jgi:hypothetical protein
MIAYILSLGRVLFPLTIYILLLNCSEALVITLGKHLGLCWHHKTHVLLVLLDLDKLWTTTAIADT